MPNVYKRRLEYVVTEELPAGGTVSGKNGITPVAQGAMQVGADYYSASDFAAQFEGPVPYEECPEDLKAAAYPERYASEQAHAEQQAEREARATERRGRRGNDRPTLRDDDSPEIAGKTTKLESPQRDLAREAEDERAKEEAERVPTSGTQSTYGK